MNKSPNFDSHKNKNRKANASNASQRKRTTLSPKNAALLAEQKRIENIKRKKARKELLDKLSAVMIFSFIGTIISLSAIAIFLFFDFHSKEKLPDEYVTVTAMDKDKKIFSDNHYFFRNGEYYISLTSLCDILDFTLHGDVKNMALSVSGKGYAAFDIGTSIVNINGTKCIMSSPSYFEYEQLFIPCSFFTRFCSDVSVEHKEKGTDRGYNLSFGKSFAMSSNANPNSYPLPIPKEKLAPVSNERAAMPAFKADLFEYEQYMNPENKDEYLTLINPSNMLSSDYVPHDLTNIVDTRKDGRNTQKMRFYAAKALEAMFIEMRANGFTDVSVTSGYRSYQYQTQLLNKEIADLTPIYGENARKIASTQIAIPGSSEHQSGLCVDMHNLSSASEAFEKQDAYKWLYSNCADFGFILRFPKDKTHITGIIFEPWHYRYVGRYHAQKIMSQGLCLEEYIESIS